MALASLPLGARFVVFVLVGGFCLAMNTLVLWLLASGLGLHYLIATLIAFFAITPLGFLLNNHVIVFCFAAIFFAVFAGWLLWGRLRVLMPLLANSGVYTIEGKPLPPPEEQVEYPVEVVSPGDTVSEISTRLPSFLRRTVS